MSKVVLPPEALAHLDALDVELAALNREKVKLILETLGIADVDKLLNWELILVTVRDKQMAVQLNKLCAYVPNLKFVVDVEMALFSVVQGVRGRRVWKER